MKKKQWMLCLGMALLIALSGCGKKTSEKKNDLASTEQTTVSVATQSDVTTKEAPQPELPKDEDGYYIANDYVKTIGETINVRVSPSVDASIYVLLAGGEVLNRVGYNDEWTKIKMDGDVFYIYSDYVVHTEPPEGVLPEDEPEDETATKTDAEEKIKKIVIDPGNQAVVNAQQIEIGPNVEETKQGASTGNVGTALGTKESELNLKYAKLLKTELESRGYEVILTRETDEINLSNKDRALLANESGATAFIRIQMNFSENDSLSGVMAVSMTSDNPYNANLYGESHNLATRLLQGILEKTACVNQGIIETDQMMAINWSEIPVAVVKLGYLSNSNEESNLVNSDYQQEMVQGIADGIDYYYNE